MTVRTSRESVTLRRPFSLSGAEHLQPAGTYTVETSEELLDTPSVPAWRRTSTVVLLRPQGGATGPSQDLEVDPAELKAVMDADAVDLPQAVAEATLGDLLADGLLLQAVRSAGLSPVEFNTLLRTLSARILSARLARESAAASKGT